MLLLFRLGPAGMSRVWSMLMGVALLYAANSSQTGIHAYVAVLLKSAIPNHKYLNQEAMLVMYNSCFATGAILGPYVMRSFL